MTSTAAHLVVHVLPNVPYRQSVLTLPFELRLAVAYDPSLCGDPLRVYARELRRWVAAKAREVGVSNSLWGGFTVIQRFGSDLRLNPHFHTLTPHGLFARVDTGSGTASVELSGCRLDPKECPDCGGRLKMVATIMRADVVTAILHAQGLPTDAPFIRPSRGPPDDELFEVWWT